MHNRQHTDQYGTKFFYFSVFSPCCTLLTKVRKCALLTSLRVCDFFVGICKNECPLGCGDFSFGVKIHQTVLRKNVKGVFFSIRATKNELSNHSMVRVNLNKSEELVTNTTRASKYIPKKPRISIN